MTDTHLNAWIESVSGANDFEQDEDSVAEDEQRDDS